MITSRWIIVKKIEFDPKNGYVAKNYMEFWNFFTIKNIKNPNDLGTLILSK